MPLLVVATPIGNLGDVSPRCREALAGARLILCEDTRRTRALLSALSVPAPELWRCDANAEPAQVAGVLARLRAGEAVALVTDAGTPAISDPGALLVAAAHREGLPVVVVAGPSSVAAALSVAGFQATPFHFLGFPPRKAGPLDAFVVEASRLPGVLVLFESGRRVPELLDALGARLPDREACLCAELTKLHERVLRGPLVELPREELPGEIVLVVGPGAPVPAEEARPEGEGLGALAEALAARWGCPRKEAYKALLELERARGR